MQQPGRRCVPPGAPACCAPSQPPARSRCPGGCSSMRQCDAPARLNTKRRGAGKQTALAREGSRVTGVEGAVRTRCCGAAVATATGGLQWLTRCNVLLQLLEREAGTALCQPPAVARSMRTPARRIGAPRWRRHRTRPAAQPSPCRLLLRVARHVVACHAWGWTASSGGCYRDAPCTQMHDTTSRCA